MGYCVYLRKSRADFDAEARGEGETLARHEAAMLELANRLRLSVDTLYKEIVSGETIAARPVMRHLLAEVENGLWEGVLVMEIERLTRGDTVDQGIMAQAFKYSGTKIITPIKTYDPNNEFDEEYFEFNLFMARREYKVINRRLQRGRLASVREGKYPGNVAPYGYSRKKLDSGKGYTLEPVPAEADTVSLIFGLYTSGERLGAARICKKLNDMRIPPRKADCWVPASVRDILMSPVYIGKIRWNWRPAVKKTVNGEVTVTRPRSSDRDCVIADGLHKAIIDEEVWYLAQEYLKSNPPRPAPTRFELKNPLSGIVYCGKCGRSMVRRPHVKRGLPDTLMCPSVSCDNISSKLSIVEDHIIDALGQWLKGFTIDWSLGSERNYREERSNINLLAKRKLEDELKTLAKQSARLHDLVEQGVYSYETFQERNKILAAKIEIVRRDIETLNGDSALEVVTKEVKFEMTPEINDVPRLYRLTDSVKLKNDLLKAVLDKVVYIKIGEAGPRLAPDAFQIDLCPKIPSHGLFAAPTDNMAAPTNWLT